MTDGVLQNNVIYTGPEFMQPFANRCAGTWRCYHQQAHWWLLSLLLSITGFSDFISIAYTCNPKSKPSLNKKKLHFYVCFVNWITQLNNDVWRASRRQKFLATLLVVQRCSSSQRRKNFPNTSNLWWEPPLIYQMSGGSHHKLLVLGKFGPHKGPLIRKMFSRYGIYMALKKSGLTSSVLIGWWKHNAFTSRHNILALPSLISRETTEYCGTIQEKTKQCFDSISIYFGKQHESKWWCISSADTIFIMSLSNSRLK